MNMRAVLVAVLFQTMSVALAACAGEVVDTPGGPQEVTAACSVGTADHIFDLGTKQDEVTATLHNEFTDEPAVIVWVTTHSGAPAARVFCDQPETVTFTIRGPQ